MKAVNSRLQQKADKDLRRGAKGVHAGKIIKDVAKIVGGGGGGKPDSARAGGKDISKIDNALAIVDELVAEQIKK